MKTYCFSSPIGTLFGYGYGETEAKLNAIHGTGLKTCQLTPIAYNISYLVQSQTVRI